MHKAGLGVILQMDDTGYIAPETAKTLPGLFCERVMRSPHARAYGFYDNEKDTWESLTWRSMQQESKQGCGAEQL